MPVRFVEMSLKEISPLGIEVIMVNSARRGQKKLAMETERNDVDTIKIASKRNGEVCGLATLQFL